MNTAQALLGLLVEMGAHLEQADQGPVDLFLLGGCSLILFEGRLGATKDLDVVEERLRRSDREASDALVAAFGETSGRSPYLDLVPGGLPPLPAGWVGRSIGRDSPSPRIRLWTLGYADLIVSKLRRWHPRDRADVRYVCDRHPEVRTHLASLTANDFFEVDWWEQMEPRRDRVLDYLDGLVDEP